MKMFEGELQNAEIALELKVHDSFHKLNVDWVKLDPSRLLQILVSSLLLIPLYRNAVILLSEYPWVVLQCGPIATELLSLLSLL